MNENEYSNLPEFVREKLVGLTEMQLEVCFALANPEDERSQNVIAEATGIGQGTITNWKNRNTNGFNNALLTLSLYYAAQLVPVAVKSWKKLLEVGKWQAIEKLIDYGLAYDQMLRDHESRTDPVPQSENLL